MFANRLEKYILYSKLADHLKIIKGIKMIKKLPLSLAFIALPTFAAPQLTTEIQAGDVWVKGKFDQTDVDFEFRNPSTGATAESSTSSDSFGFSALFAIPSESQFTPVAGLAFENEDGDDDKAKTFEGKIGFIKKSASNKNIGLLLSYEHSDNADEIRSSFDIATGFQTSGVESKNYNEIFFNFSLPKDEGGIEGGRNITVGDNLKLSVTPEIDFVVSAELGFSGDLTYTDDNSKLEYDPIFGLGGAAYINLDPQFTLSFSLHKGFGGGTLVYTSGAEVDVDIDITSFGVELVGRF